MKTKDDLLRMLRSIDHRGYPAYKSTEGTRPINLLREAMTSGRMPCILSMCREIPLRRRLILRCL